MESSFATVVSVGLNSNEKATLWAEVKMNTELESRYEAALKWPVKILAGLKRSRLSNPGTPHVIVFTTIGNLQEIWRNEDLE